jgi:hypothetical protein
MCNRSVYKRIDISVLTYTYMIDRGDGSALIEKQLTNICTPRASSSMKGLAATLISHQIRSDQISTDKCKYKICIYTCYRIITSRIVFMTYARQHIEYVCICVHIRTSRRSRSKNKIPVNLKLSNTGISSADMY